MYNSTSRHVNMCYRTLHVTLYSQNQTEIKRILGKYDTVLLEGTPHKQLFRFPDLKSFSKKKKIKQ